MHSEFVNTFTQGRIHLIIDHFKDHVILTSEDLSSMSFPKYTHNQYIRPSRQIKYCSYLLNTMTRFLFVCYPDINTPIGGVKQIYRQVSLLNELGFWMHLFCTKNLISRFLV